jgi:hypothetical protein
MRRRVWEKKTKKEKKIENVEKVEEIEVVPRKTDEEKK